MQALFKETIHLHLTAKSPDVDIDFLLCGLTLWIFVASLQYDPCNCLHI
jgi:hypothetical protein